MGSQSIIIWKDAREGKSSVTSVTMYTGLVVGSTPRDLTIRVAEIIDSNITTTSPLRIHRYIII